MQLNNCICNQIFFPQCYRMHDEPAYIDAWGYLLRIHAELTARIESDLETEGRISLTS